MARDGKARKKRKKKSDNQSGNNQSAKPPNVAVSKTRTVFHGPVTQVHNLGTWVNADVLSRQEGPRLAEGPIQESGMPPRQTPTKTGSDESTGLESGRRVPNPAEEPIPESEASSEPDDDEFYEAKRRRELRMEEILMGMNEVYKRISNKLPLTSADDCLEDRVYAYALKLPDLQPAHFSILDADTLQNLVDDQSVRSAVMAYVLPLPAFPANLQKILTEYEGVETTARCLEIAQELSSDDRDIRWMHAVMQHTAELLTETNGLLEVEGLNEGVWDTMVYTHLWDKCLSTMPDLVLQRKEIQLWACDSEPYPYLPYLPHYDAILRTRSKRSRRRSSTFSAEAPARQSLMPVTFSSAPNPGPPDAELLLIETSSSSPSFSPGSAKWIKDRHKLLGGCRAMLYRLQILVDRDADTLPHLRVVGVLQAGRCSQVFVMSCLNSNMFWCQEGEVRRFPLALEAEEGDGKEWSVAVGDLVIGVWKARQVVEGTMAAVQRYWKSKAERTKRKERQQRTEAGFL